MSSTAQEPTLASDGRFYFDNTANSIVAPNRSRFAPLGWMSAGVATAIALLLGGPWVLHQAVHVACEECDARAVRAVVRQIQAEREQLAAQRAAQAAQAAQVSSGGGQ